MQRHVQRSVHGSVQSREWLAGRQMASGQQAESRVHSADDPRYEDYVVLVAMQNAASEVGRGGDHSDDSPG